MKKIKRGSYVPWQCKTPEDYVACIHDIATKIAKANKSL